MKIMTELIISIEAQIILRMNNSHKREISNYLDTIENLNSISQSITNHVKLVRLRKKNGGYREIYVPDEELKEIQKKFNKIFLQKIPGMDLLGEDLQYQMLSLILINNWCLSLISKIFFLNKFPNN